MPEDTTFGSKALTFELNKFLISQCSLLKGIFADDSFSGRAKELKVFIGATVTTAIAISRLAQEDLLNECTMLGRGFFERAVNFCFLMTCNDDEFGQYRSHTLQKSFRSLDRQFTAGDQKIAVQYLGQKEIGKDTNIVDALKIFTNEKGKEIKRFPNKDIPTRLDVIAKNSKVDVRFFLHYQSLFYQDGSEALHGSFYGCIFHLGATQPGFDRTNAAEANLHLQKNLSLLVLDIGTLIDEMIGLIGDKSSAIQLREPSRKNTALAAALLKSSM